MLTHVAVLLAQNQDLLHTPTIIQIPQSLSIRCTPAHLSFLQATELFASTMEPDLLRFTVNRKQCSRKQAYFIQAHKYHARNCTASSIPEDRGIPLSSKVAYQDVQRESVSLATDRYFSFLRRIILLRRTRCTFPRRTRIFNTIYKGVFTATNKSSKNLS